MKIFVFAVKSRCFLFLCDLLRDLKKRTQSQRQFFRMPFTVNVMLNLSDIFIAVWKKLSPVSKMSTNLAFYTRKCTILFSYLCHIYSLITFARLNFISDKHAARSYHLFSSKNQHHDSIHSQSASYFLASLWRYQLPWQHDCYPVSIPWDDTNQSPCCKT